MKNYFGVLLLITFFLVGCKDDAPSGIPGPGLGGVTVNKYISIGNSLTAGYQAGGLYEDGQIYSFPNLIAQQLKIAGAPLGKFEQPIWGNPGSPDISGKTARLEILAWPASGPVIGSSGATAGVATNSNLPRPYDNLGIPFAYISDFLDTADFVVKSVPLPKIFFLHVLRNKSYGNSVFDQARKVTPKADIVTFWLGNNDVLIFAIYGGTAVIGNTVIPTAPTPSATFAIQYGQAFDSLRSAFPNAKIIVGNIPDVRAIPHFTTVGPAVAASLEGAFAISYQKHGTTGAGDASSYLTEANAPLLPLGAGAYVAKIGQPSGQWYKDNSITLPAGIDTTQMFGLDYRNPIPDALILDSLEIAMAGAAVTSFNQTIVTVTAAKGAALVDIYSIFNGIKKNGLKIGGETFTADYLAGGLFSLDGIHPSSKGAGIVANEFIKTMNSKFGMNVPQVDISRLPGIPAPLGKYIVNSKSGLKRSYDSMQPFLKQ
ncbi:MAG: SGNH/GDSL hydrolase family protein [Bacteroidota bacterium]|nr:SGNH/GDSL hydrolase family protein [Bacteroidota bacterium]